MHNLISYNQLAGWKQNVEKLAINLDKSMEESDLINDYYNCLIECDDDQASCKRICRRILHQSLWRVDYPPFFMVKLLERITFYGQRQTKTDRPKS